MQTLTLVLPNNERGDTPATDAEIKEEDLNEPSRVMIDLPEPSELDPEKEVEESRELSHSDLLLEWIRVGDVS